MMASNISKVLTLFSGVKNPVPAVLDRLGMRHTPYILHLRSGAQVELRPQAGDLYGFYEIMLRKDYFASGQKLRIGASVIDVGANIGCFTVVAANSVGPTGRVLAIEPEESSYRQLLRNIELNQLTNVTPLKLAVGGAQGKVTLHSDPNRLFSSIFSSVNGREVQGTDQEVQITTLDALMDAYQIPHCHYLKLDCEGAEHEIIAKMSQSTAQRIGQITMEMHKVPGFDAQTLNYNLVSLGYRRVGVSTLPFYTHSRGESDPSREHKGRVI